MKYSKKLISDQWAYYMSVGNGDYLEVFNGKYYPSIGVKMGRGDIECSQKEFEQAFMTVSNRFRTAVFKDDTTTRTETNDGNQTIIEIKPKNEK